MQDECESFSGRQRVQDYQERGTDRVGEQRLLFGIDNAWAVHGCLGQVYPRRLFPARLEHVHAHPGDNRRQPSAEVLDVTGVGAAQPQPGFLNGVVGLAGRAQRVVGDRPQSGSVGLEPSRKLSVFVHRSHSLAVVVCICD